MTFTDDGKSWSLGRPGEPLPGSFRGRRPSRFVTLLLAAGIILFSLAGLWFFLRSNSFPKLAPGRYAGTLSGVSEFGAARDWVLTISDDYKKVEAVILGQDGGVWQAQRTGSGHLLVHAGDQEIVFKGTPGDPSRPKGSFQYGDSRRSGEWNLTPVDLVSFEVDQSFRNWMLLRAEIARVERDIQVAQQLIPAQKIEIEELSQMITDESAMKARGARRVTEIDEKLAQTRAELLKASKEVEQEESQLRLAQKVSARGKLVSLARESLERETRWARSFLTGSAGSISVDLEGELKRAEDIKVLKDTLQFERESVEALARELEEKEL